MYTEPEPPQDAKVLEKVLSYTINTEHSLMIVRNQLALLLGLEEAILLQKVHNDLLMSRYLGGEEWTTMTEQDWIGDRDWCLGKRAFRRALCALEEKGILIPKPPPPVEMPRYTIDYQKLKQLIEEENGP